MLVWCTFVLYERTKFKFQYICYARINADWYKSNPMYIYHVTIYLFVIGSINAVSPCQFSTPLLMILSGKKIIDLVTAEFPPQRPVTRSFVIFFDLRLINDWINNQKA